MAVTQPTTLQRAEELAATMPTLLVAAERVASTVAQGVHGRRRIGQGDTFWQFRQYQPGDTTQRIDWRQSAKSQRVFIREHEWEAAQSIWLWRDASASMHYASDRNLPEKGDRADLLLLALASLLIRGGEHVAFMGEGYPPSSGRAVLNRMAASLLHGGAATANAPSPEPLPRDAQIVLFSDFLGPLEEIQAAVKGYAARGVGGHLLQILDPAEETFPFSGRIRFEGLEEEGDTLINRTERVRDRYRHRLAGLRENLTDLARQHDWTFSVHHTDRPASSALLALYGALARVPV
ncbi:MAG: DUF58 domain-containing protein [Proteobacteria bacterium]|nr:DUF58 domain-containing protein [Pseudomonadota bacterium]